MYMEVSLVYYAMASCVSSHECYQDKCSLWKHVAAKSPLPVVTTAKWLSCYPLYLLRLYGYTRHEWILGDFLMGNTCVVGYVVRA
jgi:hypothetical protein